MHRFLLDRPFHGSLFGGLHDGPAPAHLRLRTSGHPSGLNRKVRVHLPCAARTLESGSTSSRACSTPAVFSPTLRPRLMRRSDVWPPPHLPPPSPPRRTRYGLKGGMP